MVESTAIPPPSQPRRRVRRGGAPKGNQNRKLAAVRRHTEIRQYFLGLTRDNLNFRQHLEYLVNSKQIFKPEHAGLLKLVMQYAFGVPAPLEEDLQDMAKSLIFLSQNPIGRPEFDPLAGAKPVGTTSTSSHHLEQARPEPEPETGPFVGLDGKEKSPEEEVQLFRDPSEVSRRRADYR